MYSSITVVAGPQSSSPPAHSTNEEPSNMLCTTTFAICLMPACMHARTQTKVSGAPCPQQARCTQARGRARHAGAATELLARPWALQEEEHHGRERQRRGCKHHGRQACRQRPARNADDILSTRAGRGLVRAARRAWHAWHARQSARTTCRPPGEPARAEPSRPPARHRQWRPCCKRVALVTRACSGARGQQTADSRQCSPTGQARGRGAPVAAVPGEQHNPADAERGRRQRAAAAAPAHEALEQHGAPRAREARVPYSTAGQRAGAPAGAQDARGRAGRLCTRGVMPSIAFTALSAGSSSLAAQQGASAEGSWSREQSRTISLRQHISLVVVHLV